MNEVELMKQKFQDKGSLLIKNLLSKELCYYLTHVFLKIQHYDRINNNNNQDKQVSGAVSIPPNQYNDTILEMLWPVVEKYTNEEIIPNRSYARLYFNGNVLNPHLDRPYCEVSLTIQLAKSHDYVWPIHLEDARYDLEIGDAVLYLGCEKTHWRDKCEGPEGYYSGQLFLHYIKANGQNKQFAGEGEIPFVRDRIKQVMENKNET